MSFYEKHKTILDNAIKAVHERRFFAQYPEHPKAYGEEAPAIGLSKFEGLLNKNFDELEQDENEGFVGTEVSPYTQKSLGIKYPAFDPEKLVYRAENAFLSWKKVTPLERAGILVETLEHIKERFYEIAYATMHTTGQSFVMSFQASGPHSNDRALEAIALGLYEMQQFPKKALWEKPMGKITVKVEKEWKPIPKGVSLAIGVSTFPVWNSIPGVFASLVTGNPVIVKPHPTAILPMAIVVAEMQKVLKLNGYNPHIIQLAADEGSKPVAKHLADHRRVKLIDYTGGTTFGDYIESLEAAYKTTFTEKAGVNSVIFDSVSDLKAVLQNISFSLCLYSGQMCTAPQNFFIPENGIEAGGEKLSFNEVVNHLVDSINGLVDHPKMGAGTLGAIQNEATCNRAIDAKNIKGKLHLESRTITNPEFPDARTATPAVIEVDAEHQNIFEEELFGPIVLVIKTKNTDQSIDLARDVAARKGAISCAAYTTKPEVKQKIKEEMESVFTPVTFNYIGPIWVNQNAAFSDFHLTGGNHAGNASFTDPNFVNKRFVWVGHREVVE